MLKWDRQPRELPKHQTDRPTDNFREGNIVKSEEKRTKSTNNYGIYHVF